MSGDIWVVVKLFSLDDDNQMRARKNFWCGYLADPGSVTVASLGDGKLIFFTVKEIDDVPERLKS